MANQTEIERGLRQIQSVKKLKRIRTGLLGETNEVKIEYAKQIPSFIFSDKTYVDMHTLISHIVNYYDDNAIPKNEQFDLIVINNRAIVFNFKKNSYVSHGKLEGIGYVETGDITFATFLLYMNKMPKSEPEVGKNIMKLYLDDISIEKIMYYPDLNLKLNGIESTMTV